jgi:hypothetical protein
LAGQVDAARQGRPVPGDVIERALRQGREVAPPIKPAEGLPSTDGGAAVLAIDRRNRWPEGAPIPMRRGTLRTTEHGSTFVFTDSEDQSLGVLPNSKLEQMRNYTETAGHAVEFRILGIATEYKGTNYVLVREVSLVGQPAAKGPASPPVSAAGEQGDALKSLVAGMEATTRLKPSVGNESSATARLPEDTQLISRPGRLVREGTNWQFRIESQSTEPAELPVTVLPNLALEQMELFTSGGRRSAVFVVTGQLTAMAGQNFLLIRRFHLRPEDGNLR